MSDSRCWLATSDLDALAQQLPRAERGRFWQWVWQQPGRQGAEMLWQQKLGPLIEDQASALRHLLNDGAENKVQAFQEGLTWLRWSEQWESAGPWLADQLCQVVGALHQWLVMEEGENSLRPQWLWQAWELLQWRQRLATPLPQWWPPVQEQLIRYGALAWRQQAEDGDPFSSEGQDAIGRTLTLLAQLAALHEPLPEWIPSLQRQLVQRGLAALLEKQPLEDDHLLTAGQWLSGLRLQSAEREAELQGVIARGQANPGLDNLRDALALAELTDLLPAHRKRELQERAAVEQADQLLQQGQWQQARLVLDALAVGGEMGQTKPMIRTLHHLGCTGGTVISKCLAVMPRVALVSEVNPLNRFASDFEPTNPLLLLERSYRDLTLEEIKEDFVSRMAQVAKICRNDGMDLVIRDHSHTDFCMGEVARELNPICDFLADQYDLVSVVTVRHPLDSYLGLVAQGWHTQFTPSTLAEYSRRYLAFLDRYRDLPLRRYEDFCTGPEAFMQELCELMELDYSPTFLERFGSVKLSGDSGRGSTTEIAPRPRRAIPEEVQRDLESSEMYAQLLEKLGYSH